METTMSNAEAFAILGGFTGAVVISLVLYLLYAIAYWRVFSKAGESGWKSLIPFYNMYILYKISWDGKMFLAQLVVNVLAVTLGKSETAGLRYVGLAFCLGAAALYCVQSMKLAKAYGKSFLFGLGLIFLNPLFMMILGLGGAKYQGEQ